MYKILLVEDDKETADFVKQAFEIEDISVDVAYDGQAGYEQYFKEEYDLILLDLQMPKMSGEELLVKIRNINPYIDIIVYTNYAEFGNIKKLVNLGINGYVNKGPGADLGELVTMVKSKLEPMDEDSMKVLLNDTEVMRRE